MTLLGAAPRRYGPYVVTGFLGEGGMCTVYAARHEPSGREVALKVLRHAQDRSESLRRRFLLEWSLAVSLKHPHLIEHLEAGEADGCLYLAIELMRDGDALRLLERFPAGLPEDLLARLGRDVARGLAALHGRGLIHRDVKPENIFVAPGGMAKLGDFGLVKNAGAERGFSTEGTVLGTPDYMAPEQARGQRDIDARSDIYGLGASLYRLATGQVPFDSPTAWGVLTQIVSQDFPDPRLRRPTLSPLIAELILTACAKEREHRFADAEAMSAACAAALAACAPTTADRRSDAVPAAAAPPAPARDTARPFVLIVDDDPVVSRLYRSRFTAAGCEVRVATSARAAGAEAAARLPEAIVLDLLLPDGDGIDVLKAFRALPGAGAVPVVVMTNAYSPERIRAAEAAGASAVRAKSALPPSGVSELTLKLMGPSTHPALPPAGADLGTEEFRRLADPPLRRLDDVIAVLGASPRDLLRDRALRDLADICHGLAAATSATGLAGAAGVAAATELLAQHLLQQPQDLSASVLRTLAESVALLGTLAVEKPRRGEAAVTLKALIVDDDPIIARLATKAVQRIGMAATTISDPFAGLAAAQAEAYDIVILDVVMPGMSGQQLANLLRGSGASRASPIIFITTLKDFAPSDLSGATVDLIAKPFPMMELATKALTLAAGSTLSASARDVWHGSR